MKRGPEAADVCRGGSEYGTPCLWGVLPGIRAWLFQGVGGPGWGTCLCAGENTGLKKGREHPQLVCRSQLAWSPRSTWS